MNMVVNKRAMTSPTRDVHGDDSSLPYEIQSAKGPLHLRTDNTEDYSTSFWSQSSSDRSSAGGSRDDTMTLPVWTANPQQSPADDTLLPKQTMSSLQFSTKKRKLGIPAFLVGVVIVGFVAVFSSRMNWHNTVKQVDALTNNHGRMDSLVKKTARDIHMLKREISAMDLMIQHQHDVDIHTDHTDNTEQALDEMKVLQEHLKSLSGDTQSLKREVQTASRKAVALKYGTGVHRVEMELVFPDDNEGPSIFVIELASMSDMPHSVHTFLEMVSTGLLDGCSFILNALHVLKAAPLPYDGTSAAAKAKAFSAAGLESVAFKEYSEAFPHKQYTLGFAADGSPSFYINTEDNREIHVGDPCFGKIVEGFDAVRRLEAAPTRNGIWFEQRIGIKSARILGH